MQPTQVNLQKLDSSRGVVIPKPVLAQAGLSNAPGVEMTLDGSSIVLRRPAPRVRVGWAQAATQIAAAADDGLVLGEFGNS